MPPKTRNTLSAWSRLCGFTEAPDSSLYSMSLIAPCYLTRGAFVDIN